MQPDKYPGLRTDLDDARDLPLRERDVDPAVLHPEMIQEEVHLVQPYSGIRELANVVPREFLP